MGAEVIAAARGEERLAFCREQGAVATIDYGREDLRQRLKEIGGVDVVYDAIGGDFSEPALRALRPGGRFLVIGFAAGSIPRIALNLILLKECSVVGVQWGAWAFREPEQQAREVAMLVDLWSKGAIAPRVDATYPLEKAADALDRLAARNVRGKVVVVP
jgi:NADPH2:quinone reductase